MLRFACLVLDHDDTAVRSTPTIHYPSFSATLQQLRPGQSISLQRFAELCYDPGFEPLCSRVLAFTPEEMKIQEQNWLAAVRRTRAPFWPGMVPLLARYAAAGGHICVVSHSNEDTIRQDYAAAGAPAPKLVFGWEQGPGRRKPSPWPLQQIMARWQLAPDQLLMVDDLKPGWEMACACGVPFAAAGWGVLCDAARRDLQARADWYLERVEQLEDLLYRRT